MPLMIYYIVQRQILIRTKEIDENLPFFLVSFQWLERCFVFDVVLSLDNKYSELLLKICYAPPYLNLFFADNLCDTKLTTPKNKYIIFCCTLKQSNTLNIFQKFHKKSQETLTVLWHYFCLGVQDLRHESGKQDRREAKCASYLASFFKINFLRNLNTYISLIRIQLFSHPYMQERQSFNYIQNYICGVNAYWLDKQKST